MVCLLVLGASRQKEHIGGVCKLGKAGWVHWALHSSALLPHVQGQQAFSPQRWRSGAPCHTSSWSGGGSPSCQNQWKDSLHVRVLWANLLAHIKPVQKAAGSLGWCRAGALPCRGWVPSLLHCPFLSHQDPSAGEQGGICTHSCSTASPSPMRMAALSRGSLQRAEGRAGWYQLLLSKLMLL